MNQMEPIILIDQQRNCSVNVLASPDYMFDDILRSARRLEPNAFVGQWNLVYLDPDTQKPQVLQATDELADCLFQNITTFYWNYKADAVKVTVNTQRKVFAPRAESFSTMPSVQSFIVPQNAPPQYANVGKRIVANIIDIAIIVAIVNFFSLGVGTTMLVGWFYFALGESSKKHQATFGKRAMGLRVADENGNRLTFERTSGRFFCKVLTVITGMWGLAMMFFNNRRQSMHDRLANTLVLDTYQIGNTMTKQARNISVR